MVKTILTFSLLFLAFCVYPQEKSVKTFLSDSSLTHASVSLYVTDTQSGEILAEHNAEKSLAPASIMKLITSAAALELLGPEYTFKTTLGYTGIINKKSGRLNGNLIIKGGGDPALGSPNFSDHYQDFITRWIDDIKKAGIRRIEGRVITDDSYFDYLPVHAKWLWEDPGSYYGAGVFGLSVFDNTYEIHLRSLPDSSGTEITKIMPPECRYEYRNMITAGGSGYSAYAFAEPYSTKGWLAGSVPANVKDYVMEVAIADPPLLLAKMINERLEKEGIKVSQEPVTTRTHP
ncbi:MAG TPA: D-alanyl-D-alanine carboxypeptidase, partial [Bacteroidales bacterium]|nr:D-alanyl-D-alanine carboxypeptidase [Bacteroidales bacterium]